MSFHEIFGGSNTWFDFGTSWVGISVQQPV